MAFGLSILFHCLLYKGQYSNRCYGAVCGMAGAGGQTTGVRETGGLNNGKRYSEQGHLLAAGYKAQDDAMAAGRAGWQGSSDCRICAQTVGVSTLIWAPKAGASSTEPSTLASTTAVES